MRRRVPETDAAHRAPQSVRSLHRALMVAAGALFLGSLLLFADLVAAAVAPASALVRYFAVCWLWMGAGVFAWWRRPGNRLGLLLVWGAVTLVVAVGEASPVTWVAAVGAACATGPLAVMVHLLHAFPSGRIRGRASAVTVAGVYVTSFVLQAPLYAFDVADARLPLFVADRPDLLRLGGAVQDVVGAVVVLATSVILVGRMRRARPEQRRVSVPLFGYGVLAVLWIPVSSSLLPGWGVPDDVVALSQLVVVAGVPVAFALAVLRGAFARTGELQELSDWLSARDDRRSRLGIGLASVLGDPSLQLVFRVPGEQRHVDADGRPVALPGPDGGRGMVDVELGGEPIGAVIYDAELIDDPEVVRAAGRVVALGVDRERLTAALHVTEQSLRRSRERIVETADRERRRIAQDLHDGLQVKLVLLALEAQQVANELAPGERTREQATDLRHGIDAAAADLRALVHAVMPSALLERGLTLAVEDLLDRVPLRSVLDVTGVGRLSMPVQSTAYFVVAEAVANVVKHADAGKVRVHVLQRDDTLTVDVEDDGVGGAAIERGTGIRGLLDRVDVLGGELRLTSPPGVGTRLTVRLPVVLDPDRGAEPATESATG